MQISAIIMAGGKGKRFNFNEINSKYEEKLLLPLGDKYLIEHVIDAVLATKKINRVIVAVSPHTPLTRSILKTRKKEFELLDTPGAGYHSDLKFIIKILNLNITMTIVADMPLIKSEILEEIIEKYFILKKPALSVMADVKLFNKHGLIPTLNAQSDKEQKNLIPLGINIIDGNCIDEPVIDQANLITERVELIYNINTVNDYLQLKSNFN